MKTRTLTLCALVALLLTALAGHPRVAEARDNIYMGADLGGLGVFVCSLGHCVTCLISYGTGCWAACGCCGPA